MSTSIRPTPPATPRVLLQQRDRRLLEALFTHRYLTVRHLHALIFSSRSYRRAQDRLRQLWKGRYLERSRVIREDWSQSATKSPPTEFLYALAKRGAVHLAARIGEDLDNIPHTPEQNAQGFATLQHHLVVTDCLVALQAATSAEQKDTELVSVEREHTLRTRLGTHALSREVKRPWLIPDGAFTLKMPQMREPVTFYLEVVRSLPVGGRQAFFTKLTGYVEALREERLQRIWNHPRIAAVLILAPTPERAERLRAQAERLPKHAERFWFASYLTGKEGGGKTNALTPGTILTPCWRDGTGATRHLASPVYS